MPKPKAKPKNWDTKAQRYKDYRQQVFNAIYGAVYTLEEQGFERSLINAILADILSSHLESENDEATLSCDSLPPLRGSTEAVMLHAYRPK